MIPHRQAGGNGHIPQAVRRGVQLAEKAVREGRPQARDDVVV
ncbi:hypothetical protein SDC9_179097 [bioreactor metagenome]|uniref:Uncharacterized protein n=1 Tax=bioreactor metagenome TaxID=1076179 RepID=A0A645H734_9ZZZZ